MKYKWSVLCTFAILLCACNNRVIDLSGQWKVALHESKKMAPCKPNWGLGPTQNIMYEPTHLETDAKREGVIELPSTLDEGGFGNAVKEDFIGCLSRKFQFIGEAVYSREFETKITGDWILKLERVLWQSIVKIDGIEVGKCESLGTPHRFVIKNLAKGKHKIEITIDNTMIYPIGEKSHAYGEHMQTIWNGILGEISLTSLDDRYVDVQKVHAPYPANEVAISFIEKIEHKKYALALYHNKKKMVEHIAQVEVINGVKTISIPLKGTNIEAWDEFSPNLYTLVLKLDDKEVWSKRIGFRSLKRDGNKLFINGHPLFVRGNIDNCHFPLTGHPSMNKDDWKKIMKIQKENGANTIRFHSYCPPEAAFEAADELGLYLAPEAGIWIDWWMPKYTVPIGKNNDEDAWLHNELEDIEKEYGTHASFTMLCIGNELGSCDFNLMGGWIDNLKLKYGWREKNEYNNRLYTLSTARTLTKVDDYFVTHQYPYVGIIRHLMFPYTSWNYDTLYAKTKTPAIAHEIGQWPVYPDWREIDKYSGVLRARNLENLRAHAETNGVLQYADEYHYASAMQSRMMYKDEMESFMRTASCNGLHLLGMQDYSGQGEALIGWLNSFYEMKGCWKPEEVRRSFAPIVTLAEFRKYGWTNDETFTAKLLVRNQQIDLKNIHIFYQLKKSDGDVVVNASIPVNSIDCGELKIVGNVELPLMNLGSERLTLTTQLCDEHNNALSEANEWNIWVFQKQQKHSVPNNVLITDNLSEAIKGIECGKKVIIDASSMGNGNSYQRGDWGSVYWSTTWFPGQQMQTLGVCIDRNSPIVNDFHCDGYSDWIWWNVFENGRVFDLKDLKNYHPTFMAVPDFHNNQLLAGVFELNVDGGKVLVSGYKLDGDHIEQIVFRNAIIKYVASEQFNPNTKVDKNWLIGLLNTQSKTAEDLPNEFKGALLYVECGTRFEQQRAWSKLADNAYMTKNIDYEATGFVVKDNSWVTNSTNEVNIQTPAGELGVLHLLFNTNNVKGNIEGRNFNTNTQNSISLPIDREDCLDGHLILKLNASEKNKIALKRIVFTKAE